MGNFVAIRSINLRLHIIRVIKEEIDIVKFVAIRRSINCQADDLVRSCLLSGGESIIIIFDISV